MSARPHSATGSVTVRLPVALLRQLDALCALTERIGWQGRVAFGHGSKFSCLPVQAQAAIGKRLGASGKSLTSHFPAGPSPVAKDVNPLGVFSTASASKLNEAICAEKEPELIDRGQGHPVACHFAEALDVI